MPLQVHSLTGLISNLVWFMRAPAKNILTFHFWCCILPGILVSLVHCLLSRVWHQTLVIKQSHYVYRTEWSPTFSLQLEKQTRIKQWHEKQKEFFHRHNTIIYEVHAKNSLTLMVTENGVNTDLLVSLPCITGWPKW